MSGLFDVWNRLGDAWVGWILERSLVSAIALAIVAAVVGLLRGRLSAHVPSRLFLLPLLVLVLPLERALPTHWPEPLPAGALALVRSDVADPAPRDRSGRSAADRFAPAEAGVVPGAGGEPAAAGAVPNVAAVSLAAWILLLGVGTSRMIARQRRGNRLLSRTSRTAGATLQRRFERACRSAGLQRDIALRISPHLHSPATSGIRRAVVYLPPDAEVELTPAQLDFVLAHELEHVRRRDVLTEALVHIARIGWCFHPGVWITHAAIARWREYACDEAALAQARGVCRAPLAEGLFRMIVRANERPRPVVACAQHLSTRSFMQNRLSRILDGSRAPRRRLTLASTAILALSAVLALTAARAQQTAAAPPAIRSVQGEVDVALDQAATWLLRNQEEDGRWANRGEAGRKYQRDHNEVHVTALAIRALLPAIDGPRRGEITAAVQRGAAFLERSQTDAGRFGPEDVDTMAYGHGAALRALSAVQRVAPTEDRLTRIERGVRYAENTRNPYMGWRYGPRDGDNDSKITGMMLLALHDATELGIEVDPEVFIGARQLLTELTDEENGRTGFVRRGQTMSRFTTKIAEFPGELSEEPTAMKLMIDLAFGEKPAGSKAMRRAIALVVDLPPEWSRERGSIDYSYWNFGARAMAGVGGYQADLWRDKLRAALLPNRVVDSGAAHWPAVDAWSHSGMEAYATATAMLALQSLR